MRRADEGSARSQSGSTAPSVKSPSSPPAVRVARRSSRISRCSRASPIVSGTGSGRAGCGGVSAGSAVQPKPNRASSSGTKADREGGCFMGVRFAGRASAVLRRIRSGGAFRKDSHFAAACQRFGGLFSARRFFFCGTYGTHGAVEVPAVRVRRCPRVRRSFADAAGDSSEGADCSVDNSGRITKNANR